MPQGCPARLIEKSLQAARDEAPRFVGAEVRPHEVGSLVVEGEEPILVRRHRKNQFRSSIHSGSMSCSGHLPSTSSSSVLNASHPTQ